MSKENVLEGIREVMLDYIEEVPETLDPEMVLNADMGIDSFALASMICAFEEKFDIEIPDRDLGKFHTLGDISDYIEAKKN